MQNLASVWVNDLDRVTVRRTNINDRVILRERDTTRPLSDFDGACNLVGFGVDDADGVIVFIGDPNFVR